MISTQALEDRIFDYFNIIYGNNALSFGFATDANQRFIVDRQTNAPRVSDETVLYFRIQTNQPMGRARGSTRSRLDRNTNKETVEIWNETHVVVNILSKDKGLAKDALNFLLASCNSERDALASTSSVLPFDLLLHRIDNISDNLAVLETNAWMERFELNMWFNYQDEIELDEIQWMQQPIVAPDVNDIIDWETTLKIKG